MKTLKKFALPILIFFVFIGLAIWAPSTAEASSKVLWSYAREMLLIMPPVFILMGLMEVWVPKDKIQKWLGNDSGIKGALLSIALGTLPTGPLYVAFPMTASLMKKGAGVANIVLFLGSWAALKIPQLMIEIEFLGPEFTALRFALTLAALILVGLVMELILRKNPGYPWMTEKKDEV
jgi:uncharacterized membrane protein YraQ (UPF0718 family)